MFPQNRLDLKFSRLEIGSTPNIGSQKCLQNAYFSMDFQNLVLLKAETEGYQMALFNS